MNNKKKLNKYQEINYIMNRLDNYIYKKIY